MKIVGFDKIQGITIRGYVLMDTKVEGNVYRANIVDMNTSPLTNAFSFHMETVGDVANIRIIHFRSGYSRNCSIDRRALSSLTSFVSIYTSVLENILEDMEPLSMNGPTHSISHYNI